MAYTSSQVVQAVPTGINSALVLISGEQNLGIGRNIAYFALGYGNNFTNGQSLSIDLFSPQTAKNTHYGPGVFWNGEVTNAGFIAGIHKSTSIFDGFTIYPQSSTLSGSYKVYGYTNS
jgi:hypothetical protein